MWRTNVGKVYRLYSRDTFEEMEPDTIPEIQRSSLIGTVLTLKAMGVNDILGFEFVDPPDPTLVIAALRQLFLLGAFVVPMACTCKHSLTETFMQAPWMKRVPLLHSETQCTPCQSRHF
jgi:HrpA-like RNA helicase